MPCTAEELEKFHRFTRQVSTDAALMEFDPNMTLWHYTNGPGFLGMIESGAIRATQVAAVNDSTETVYATRLYRKAIIRLKDAKVGDDVAQEFLQGVLDETEELPEMPSHADSKFFVSCFSELQDDINQWLKYGGEHGENGYAIGFRAIGLRIDGNTVVVRVNYDSALHQRIAEDAARLTLEYYLEGLVGDRAENPAQWGKEFFQAWDQAIYRLSPVVKNSAFNSEREYRMVHELQSYDMPSVRYQQKSNLLGRYMDLKPNGWEGLSVPRFPIQKVMIGPGRHKGITKRSVESLLQQMGYTGIEVLLSERPVQRP
jgi:hypothetical protein